MSIKVIPLIVLMILLAPGMKAQTAKKINGIAVERRGDRITFCSVTIKGNQNSTMTDSCGFFQLWFPPEEFTIVFNCSSTHDFVTFEERINPIKLQEGDTILFRVRRHGKISKNRCKSPLPKRVQKIKVRN